SVQYNYIRNGFGDKIIVGANLSEFLQLIEDAKFVITDSFHGTVLSVNFCKQMIVMNNKGKSMRCHSFLNSVHFSRGRTQFTSNYNDKNNVSYLKAHSN
ncbi:MAG: polysaccharide pyruvyl transferase family protein, partial [Desulfobacterales bacterium]|nr:polysaccharide pyruvyl transferase family protein [Desulfobacterales bacterium]